jgi:hypothetical protein
MMNPVIFFCAILHCRAMPKYFRYAYRLTFPFRSCVDYIAKQREKGILIFVHARSGACAKMPAELYEAARDKSYRRDCVRQRACKKWAAFPDLFIDDIIQ